MFTWTWKKKFCNRELKYEIRINFPASWVVCEQWRILLLHQPRTWYPICRKLIYVLFFCVCAYTQICVKISLIRFPAYHNRLRFYSRKCIYSRLNVNGCFHLVLTWPQCETRPHNELLPQFVESLGREKSRGWNRVEKMFKYWKGENYTCISVS